MEQQDKTVNQISNACQQDHLQKCEHALRKWSFVHRTHPSTTLLGTFI